MVLIEEIPERQAADRKVTFKDEPLAAKTSGKPLIMPLVVFHATLVALVRFQYGQEVEIKLVLKESWLAIPIFWGLFEYVHPHLATKWGQISVAFATIIGTAYLVYIANELGYYAVMYRAPPVGSLVVWAFMELNIVWSLVSILVVALFMLYKGYSL